MEEFEIDAVIVIIKPIFRPGSNFVKIKPDVYKGQYIQTRSGTCVKFLFDGFYEVIRITEKTKDSIIVNTSKLILALYFN